MPAKCCTGLHSLTAIITSAIAQKKFSRSGRTALFTEYCFTQFEGGCSGVLNFQYLLKIQIEYKSMSDLNDVNSSICPTEVPLGCYVYSFNS